MALTIKKQTTDNPFIDSLLYCVKILSYGSILKDDRAANEQEQLDSLHQAELYIYAMENGADFQMYDYDEAMIASAITPAYIMNLPMFVKNKNSIPEQFRDKLVKLARQKVIDKYVEKNNYYRMLAGLPDYGDKGIPFGPYSYLLPKGENVTVSYVHELGPDGARMLELYGILDAIKMDYPKAKYLDYMYAGISIYKARKSVDKQILYMPSSGNRDIDDLFRRKYELVRTYVARRVDSKAMEYESSNYQGFLCAFIFFLTILDMIVEVQDHIIKKDILDARCIQYIFDMYGVPYYRTIPLKYQIMMCKNINELVQYKSSPQDMFNFINYFGADSVEIYKYYLLRDRNTDVWGNYEYHVTEKTESIPNNGAVVHTRTGSYSPTNKIPFPFEYFLNKGNVMVVWATRRDGTTTRLQDGEYSVVNYNEISISPSISSQITSLRYEFFYDSETKNAQFNPDKRNGIFYKSQVLPPNNVRKNPIPLSLPYARYLYDGNKFLVSIGGLILDETAYTVNSTRNTITIDSKYKIKDKVINIVYFWGPTIKTSYIKTNVVATSNKQLTFKVPEPFDNYCRNGNSFFVTFKGTFISDERYSYNETNNTITFHSNLWSANIKVGEWITFHFIYSHKSIYTKLSLSTLKQTVKADKQYQYTFKINPEFAKYIDNGYKAFVKLRGWYLTDGFFDIYNDNLTLRDRTIALAPGEIIEVSCIHAPYGENITSYAVNVMAGSIGQKTFYIDYPIDDYWLKKNLMIIDVAGYPLSSSQYTISGNTLTITDPDHYPYKGETVGMQFIYNRESDYSIEIEQQDMIASTKGQTDFKMNLPFYPYFETNQGILVFVNSTLVPSSQYIISGYTLSLKEQSIQPNTCVSILYVFNKKFKTDSTSHLIKKIVTVPASNADSDYMLPVPVPFEGYIENDWPFFVETNRVRVEENTYEIVAGGFGYITPQDITKHDSYTFYFVYKPGAPFVVTTQSEDFERDISMLFLRIPLKAMTDTDSYVRKKEKVKAYDAMTLADKFWDGEDGSEDSFKLHNAIRAAIAEKEFNYSRTKYMSVSNLIDVTAMSFQISYFYNMLYDDVFKEELLVMQIPSISPYKKFKISHIFCYLTALAYLFKGIDDNLMREPSQILYIKGFNFRSDLAKLKQSIKDKRFNPNDYDVWGFLNPPGQIPDMKRFIEIYNTNKEIHKVITQGMANAKNYDVYSIWKMLYDSLMIFKFNMTYFKLNNGKVAETFSEFLQEKDNVLYVSLKNMEQIADEMARQEAIVQMIQDIVYLMEDYIDSKEFKYIFYNLPGASGEYLLEYLFTMINFFKSYKVVLNSMSTEFNFGSSEDDPTANLLRPTDITNMQIHNRYLQYITLNEKQTMKITLPLKKDLLTARIRDRVFFKYKET